MTGRSIVKSTAPATFNNTYAAAGPFTGYRPYATGGPDVLWAEGTAEVRFASNVLGNRVSGLDSAMSSWNSLTSGSENAPLGSDQTVTGPPGQRVPRVADLGRRELDPDGPAQLLLELERIGGAGTGAPAPARMAARCRRWRI